MGFFRAIAALLFLLATPQLSHSNETVTKGLFLDIVNVGANRLLAVGERGRIFISNDQGTSWTRVESPTQTTLTSIFFIDENRGWISGHEGTILSSDDGGLNWSVARESLGADEPLFAVTFADANRGVATGAFGLILASNDGGKTWRKQSIDSDAHLYCAMIFRDRFWVGGENGRLFSRSIASNEWRVESSPLHSSIFGLVSLDSDGLVAYGFRGFVAKRSDGSWKVLSNTGEASWYGGRLGSDGIIALVGAKGARARVTPGRWKIETIPVQDRRDLTAIAETPGTFIMTADGGIVTVRQ